MSARSAREIIRSAIGVMCREAGAPFTARPVIRSEPGGPTAPEPEPLAAIMAAVSLRHAAVRAVAGHARNAREDGRTWQEIGEAMGVKPDPAHAGGTVSVAAFLAVAPDLGHGTAFAWTCPSCLRLVTDYGPEAGNMADQERGHAEGCVRFAATVAAWDKSWEDEGDG